MKKDRRCDSCQAQVMPRTTSWMTIQRTTRELVVSDWSLNSASRSCGFLRCDVSELCCVVYYDFGGCVGNRGWDWCSFDFLWLIGGRELLHDIECSLGIYQARNSRKSTLKGIKEEKGTEKWREGDRCLPSGRSVRAWRPADERWGRGRAEKCPGAWTCRLTRSR